MSQAFAALTQDVQLKLKLVWEVTHWIHRICTNMRIQEGVLPQRKHPAATFVEDTQPQGSQKLHL